LVYVASKVVNCARLLVKLALPCCASRQGRPQRAHIRVNSSTPTINSCSSCLVQHRCREVLATVGSCKPSEGWSQATNSVSTSIVVCEVCSEVELAVCCRSTRPTSWHCRSAQITHKSRPNHTGKSSKAYLNVTIRQYVPQAASHKAARAWTTGARADSRLQLAKGKQRGLDLSNPQTALSVLFNALSLKLAYSLTCLQVQLSNRSSRRHSSNQVYIKDNAQAICSRDWCRCLQPHAS
jgi:hypothetical protein